MSSDTGTRTDLLDQIEDLHGQGLYLQAYDVCQKLGPLKEWTGKRERVLAGRMAYNLGSHKLGCVMHRLAFREHPQDFEVIYFHTLSMLRRRSILRTYEAMKKIGDFEGAPKTLQADWFALKSETFTTVRDFETAEQWMDRALELEPDRAWLHIQKTYLLERQDRNEEAIESAEKALELRPWYRPAVQNLAYRYVQANRDEESLELLRAGIEKIESGDLRAQLAALYTELERYKEAREIYEGIDRYYPLLNLDKDRVKWLSAMRSDTAYYTGDFKLASKLAESADTPFYKSIAERLGEENVSGNRVKLPVKFVRQHHFTCAPATLSAISGFWNIEAEHLDVAEEICYDGTPAHSERKWADTNGFVTREFRVTSETAQELIDRKIPFTLTTVDPGNAHLQAVIGYDTYRRTLLIRDPGERHFSEMQTEKMLEHYGASGPRGMAMVPVDRAELLEGIHFEDSEFYDHLFDLELALQEHDRGKAQAVHEKMKALDPGHRLTIWCSLVLSRYDADTHANLEAIDGLLEKYPKDVNLQMLRFNCLQELGKREERIELLHSMRKEKDCDPMIGTRLASELIEDAREQSFVEFLLTRGIKYRPHETQNFSLLAHVRLDQQKQDEALLLFRFAACLEDKNEQNAKSYFFAARTQNETASALKFIEDRVRRFGKISSLPYRIYCWAYDQLEKTSDAFKVLAAALKRHPDDGELLLFTADYFAQYGKIDKAKVLLERAREKSHPLEWRRASAFIATFDGRIKEAIAHWKEIIDQNPFRYTAHRFVADLLADDQGRPAAIEHLRKYVARFPHSYPLHMMLIEWLQDEPTEVIEAELQKFIEKHPADAWGLRRLAFVHLRNRKFDLAARVIGMANEVEPSNPENHYVRGQIEAMQNRMAEARQHFREALLISIDYEQAISELIQCCTSKSEREKELQFVYEQLDSQVIFGDGLLTFRLFAQSCLDPDQLLTMLKNALRKGPDLWHAWSAVIGQLSDMQEHDKAIRLAAEATRRFPLLPKIWMDRAAAYGACGKIDQEIESLLHAKRINPAWGQAARMLAEAYEKKGDFEAAKKEIEKIIVAEPRDPRNHGFLANLMWEKGEKKEALDKMAEAVRIDPDYETGWSTLRAWSVELRIPDYDVKVAREFTESRPNEARSWLVLAGALDQPHQVEEALAALERGLRLDPLNLPCHTRKALTLVAAGRYDQAIAACYPPEFRGQPPVELVARAAWVESQRGNFQKAVADMEQVVGRDHDYFWAWTRLAEWYEILEREDDYYRASEQMVRLGPQNPVSWGYLADAELRKRQLAKAKQYFRQAVQIAPNYHFAFQKLYELYVEDREYDEARNLVRTVSGHLSPEWVLAEEIRIDSLEKKQEDAFRGLRKLCQLKSDDISAIDYAVDYLFRADWQDRTLRLLTEEINQPTASPGCAHVYVHLSTSMNRWENCEKQLAALRSRPDLWKEGSSKFLFEAATSGQIPRMERYIASHQQELFSDNKTWEGVATAYNEAHRCSDAVNWMRDWQQRPGLTSAMLFQLLFAHWELKQDHEAVQLAAYAMKHLEPDHSVPRYGLFFAVYETFHGEDQVAFDNLSEIEAERLNPFYLPIYEALMTLYHSFLGQVSYEQCLHEIGQVWGRIHPSLRSEPIYARFHAMLLWKCAKVYGKTFKAMWLKWKADRVK